MALAAFHPFPSLPSELRIRIWELTVEPRIVEVRVVVSKDRSPVKVKVSTPTPDARKPEWIDKRPPPMRRHLHSPTAVPAQLQTCREARKHLATHPDTRYRYEKAFSDIATTPCNGYDPVPEGDPRRERYVWFNFDNDMVSIGDTDLHEFRDVAHQVRRLRIRRSIDCEYFSRTESQLIGKLFKNLAEIHMVLLWGIRSGYAAIEDIDFPCGAENVYFVDPEEMGGRIINSVDLDALVIREYEETLARQGKGVEEEL